MVKVGINLFFQVLCSRNNILNPMVKFWVEEYSNMTGVQKIIINFFKKSRVFIFQNG